MTLRDQVRYLFSMRGIVPLLICVVGGCNPPVVNALATGPRRPPLSAPCGMRIEPKSDELAARSSEVGKLCVSLRNYGAEPTVERLTSDPETRAAMEERACSLGGNVLVAVGFCSTGEGKSSRTGVEFTVFASSPSAQQVTPGGS